MRTWKRDILAGRGYLGDMCFNGATPMRTWKLLRDGDVLFDDDLLQWGHAHEDVETRKADVGDTHLTVSFNGATPMRTWKLWYVLLIVGATRMLQWGHAHEDVET